MANPTPEEIRRNFEELQRLASQLRKDFSSYNLRPVADDAAVIKDLLASWQGELNEARDSAESISGAFSDVLNQISKSNIGLKTARSSYNRIARLADEIADHQLKKNKLTQDEIQSISDKLNQEQRILKNNISNLRVQKAELYQAKRRGPLTAAQEKELQKVKIALQESEEVAAGQNKQFETLITLLKDVEKETDVFNSKLGFLGSTLDGVVGTFEKMGFGGLSQTLGLDEAKKKMAEVAQVQADITNLGNEIANLNKNGLKAAQLRAGFGGKELKEKQLLLDKLEEEAKLLNATNGKFSVLMAGLKSMGKSSLTNLMDPVALMTQMQSALVDSDKAAGQLAKDFNMTYAEALNTRRELSNMATLSGDVAVNTKGLQESMVAVGQSLGSNAQLNEKDLITFTKLREQAGYTNEELIGIQKLSLVNGKTLEDNTKEILGGAEAYATRNGFVVNEKEVLREVSKASASLKLTLGGSAKAVAEAVVQSKQFGLNLEQAEKISQSLLQFETSIEDELSAELLTGKNLNFERARSLALEGKTAEAAAEVAKQVGTAKDFGKLNVIQQEALAKAAGMERDELAQSLMDREALTKLSAKEGETAQQAFNRRVKEVGLEQAKKDLGDEALANSYAQQSVQERLNQSTEKLKEVFVSLAEPILAVVSPLVDLLNVVLPGINLLLQGIIYPVKLLADGFNSLFTLSGGFTDHLMGALKLLGGIAGTYLLIKTYQAIANRQAIIGNAAESTKLSILIAEAAAYAVANPFKALAGLAIAGAVTAGLYSLIKGDDIMSPGDGSSGYGKRTLFGPEGAIQLNNKDTVIAGTDLFKKGDDVMSAPKGAISVSNSTAPKPAPVDSNALLAAQMKRSNDLKEQEMRRDRTVSTLRIQ